MCCSSVEFESLHNFTAIMEIWAYGLGGLPGDVTMEQLCWNIMDCVVDQASIQDIDKLSEVAELCLAQMSEKTLTQH